MPTVQNPQEEQTNVSVPSTNDLQSMIEKANALYKEGKEFDLVYEEENGPVWLIHTKDKVLEALGLADFICKAYRQQPKPEIVAEIVLGAIVEM